MTDVLIDELDWTKLDGQTIRVTIKVMGEKAYLIEGQHVLVADLSKGPVADELPFFGPRSLRTGPLTDDQKRALDILIREGYTTHRAAMLLGIHDSTVQARKKALRGSTPRLASPRRYGGAGNPLPQDQIAAIKYWMFYTPRIPNYEIARRCRTSDTTVAKYVKLIAHGAYNDLTPQPLDSKIIEHQEEL